MLCEEKDDEHALPFVVSMKGDLFACLLVFFSCLLKI